MVISPGIILVPSNMFILKEKLSGYNNVLTLATKKMRFGLNSNVNYDPQTTTPATPTHEPQLGAPRAKRSSDVGYFFGSMFITGLVLVRFANRLGMVVLLDLVQYGILMNNRLLVLLLLTFGSNFVTQHTLHLNFLSRYSRLYLLLCSRLFSTSTPSGGLEFRSVFIILLHSFSKPKMVCLSHTITNSGVTIQLSRPTSCILLYSLSFLLHGLFASHRCVDRRSLTFLLVDPTYVSAPSFGSSVLLRTYTVLSLTLTDIVTYLVIITHVISRHLTSKP